VKLGGDLRRRHRMWIHSLTRAAHLRVSAPSLSQFTAAPLGGSSKRPPMVNTDVRHQAVELRGSLPGSGLQWQRLIRSCPPTKAFLRAVNAKERRSLRGHFPDSDVSTTPVRVRVSTFLFGFASRFEHSTSLDPGRRSGVVHPQQSRIARPRRWPPPARDLDGSPLLHVTSKAAPHAHDSGLSDSGRHPPSSATAGSVHLPQL
jgi:hypothetical protein